VFSTHIYSSFRWVKRTLLEPCFSRVLRTGLSLEN
jgi:hypothetical protein